MKSVGWPIRPMRMRYWRWRIPHNNIRRRRNAYSAIRLFLQRARRAQTSFRLTTADVPYIVRICELVDGMPLGLELAAPWVRSMSCQEIVAEIENSLDFLSTSLRNLPERHHSLHVVFAQTWAQLTEAEQLALSKLSVFRGGCERVAAETITDATFTQLSAPI